MDIFFILQIPLFQLISELPVFNIDLLISVRKEENKKRVPQREDQALEGKEKRRRKEEGRK